jgi:hypothetical protein
MNPETGKAGTRPVVPELELPGCAYSLVAGANSPARSELHASPSAFRSGFAAREDPDPAK